MRFSQFKDRLMDTAYLDALIMDLIHALFSSRVVAGYQSIVSVLNATFFIANIICQIPGTCLSLRLITELMAHGHYKLGCRGYGLQSCTLQFKISSWISVYCLCIGHNIFYRPLNASESRFLRPRMISN